jgi:hypothetical protein
LPWLVLVIDSRVVAIGYSRKWCFLFAIAFNVLQKSGRRDLDSVDEKSSICSGIMQDSSPASEIRKRASRAEKESEG